jgi:ATP-binding cassette, subfamily B, bacterial
MMFEKQFPFYPQHDTMDCAPACLQMIAKYHGQTYSLEYLREICYLNRNGVSLSSLADAAEQLGYRTLKARISFEQLCEEAPLPCVLYWNQDHFVVLHKVEAKRKWWQLGRKGNEPVMHVADPAYGPVKISKPQFMKAWITSADEKGIALLMYPKEEFFTRQSGTEEKYNTLRNLFRYAKPYRKYFLQVMLGLLLASLFSLAFPFLTQALMDGGIARRDVGFVGLILLSQLLLFAGSLAISLIRNWIMLHINTRISITIISDFLYKLMRLPVRFFDSKNMGDINQRIADHQRIENFLTSTTINILFSIITLLIFLAVLGYYSLPILLLFTIGSVISVTWTLLFMKQRKKLDYIRFQRMSENQDSIYEIINGMQEIKLNNNETYKRWEWEKIQTKFFKLNISSLTLAQYQQTGSSFITQLKNILVSYMAAMEVINGSITLGMMLSISYIVGQMSGPIEQLSGFFNTLQDARISFDRLGEIHNKEPEESLQEKKMSSQSATITKEDGINIYDLTFHYEGPNSPAVLKDVNISIPYGKVTAIVGSSGSGKTTLIKLLLKFYEPASGNIFIGNTNLQELSPQSWRHICGTVMQEGYIFNDTIARNIAADGEEIDEEKMELAARVANMDAFVKDLALGYTTKIGNSGVGLSTGQKQRILIARAVYKNPEYLFFDEATSSLDANNERTIVENLKEFLEGKTVVVVAHRLSTVRNADQIIMLEKGRVVEAGTHDELIRNKSYYFNLVSNQLELASD